MNMIRELRLVPIGLFAVVCLLSLKILGFIAEDRAPLADIDFASTTVSIDKSRGPAAPDIAPASAAAAAPVPAPQRGKGSWAKEMFNYPDTTGSIGASRPVDKASAGKGDAPDAGRSGDKVKRMPVGINGRLLPLTPAPPPGERALLESLQERRQELDTRARELEIRENLLKAAEQQLEIRMNELREQEARTKMASANKDEAAAVKFKSLVAMYENMRAKDAAKIFDRLDLTVLLDVAARINPRRMSEILARMEPQNAEQLTVALANRANSKSPAATVNDLPKIEGQPRS